MVWMSDCGYTASNVVRCYLADDAGKQIAMTQEFAISHLPTIKALQFGLPVDPAKVPKVFRLQTNRQLPDLFILHGGLLAVSRRVKSVLAEHQLGQTTYYPIEMRARENIQFEDAFFLLHILEKKDTLAPSVSNVIRQPHESLGADTYWHNSTTLAEITLSAAARDGADLWLEARLARGVFFSDRLAKACQDAKIAPLVFFPVVIR